MGRDLVPLTLEGTREVDRAAEELPPLALLLSSPMTRALQTAAILAARHGTPLCVEFDLHEWLPDFACTYDRVEAVTAAHEEFLRCSGEWPPGESRSWEPRSSVAKRVRAVLNRYDRETGTVGVVCHGGVIEALMGESVATGCWTEYRSAATLVAGSGR
jgi:broad specificity phosphatase PhoE